MRYIFLSFILLAYCCLISQTHTGPQTQIDRILAQSKSFSKAYVDADYNGMMHVYSTSAKILPAGSPIVEGYDAIKSRWILPDGDKVLKHISIPEEINIIKDHAYDYGYYEGETLKANGEKITWKGKYVIIWRKENKDWKIYLDIWNRVN